MTHPDEMNEQELAEAVAVEVLGAEYADESTIFWSKDGGKSFSKMAGIHFPITFQGRAAIRDWAIGMGLEIEASYCQLEKAWTYRLRGPDPEYPPHGEATDPSEERALAKAALLAVRGERGEG